MKLLEGISKKYSDEPYYDLFDGGYIKPEKLLDSEEDIKKINDAVKVIEDFMSIAVTDNEE